MLAGGGIKGGFVHGASDRIGARPSQNPVTPADVVATIYSCLGVPTDLELQDRLGLVPRGNPRPTCWRDAFTRSLSRALHSLHERRECSAAQPRGS